MTQIAFKLLRNCDTEDGTPRQVIIYGDLTTMSDKTIADEVKQGVKVLELDAKNAKD